MAAARDRLLLLVLLGVSAASTRADTGNRLSFALFLGSAVNASTNLTIEQEDEPDLRINADYDTRGFDAPVYYAWRAGYGDSQGAWEIQLIHHKIYLENPPSEVQRFEITHGYNLLTVNRSFRTGTVDLRVGGGVVIAHTESTVRGEYEGGEGIGMFGSGYELAGPVLIAGTGVEYPRSSRFFVDPDPPQVEASAPVARKEKIPPIR